MGVPLNVRMEAYCKQIVAVIALLALLVICVRLTTDLIAKRTTLEKYSFVVPVNNPYTVFVDGINKGTCYGHSTFLVTISAGTHTLRVLQQSGYLIYPTDLSTTAVVTKCYKSIYDFP